MKKYLVFLPFAFALIFLSCKDKLPSSVGLGETEVHLNGCEDDYKPYFRYFRANGFLNLGFTYQKGNTINVLGFSWLSLSTNKYKLHAERVVREDAAFATFDNIVEGDLDGYIYELINPSEGYCHIENLDTLSQTVKGRFRAEFKRTNKNGWKDLDLPEILLFEGVFNEHYQVR